MLDDGGLGKADELASEVVLDLVNELVMGNMSRVHGHVVLRETVTVTRLVENGHGRRFGSLASKVLADTRPAETRWLRISLSRDVGGTGLRLESLVTSTLEVLFFSGALELLVLLYLTLAQEVMRESGGGLCRTTRSLGHIASSVLRISGKGRSGDENWGVLLAVLTDVVLLVTVSGRVLDDAVLGTKLTGVRVSGLRTSNVRDISEAASSTLCNTVVELLLHGVERLLGGDSLPITLSSGLRSRGLAKEGDHAAAQLTGIRKRDGSLSFLCLGDGDLDIMLDILVRVHCRRVVKSRDFWKRLGWAGKGLGWLRGTSSGLSWLGRSGNNSNWLGRPSNRFSWL